MTVTAPESDRSIISEPVVDLQVAEKIRQFLYREARLLDDRDFDEWIECYHPEAPFWMPSWDVDDTLVTDPQNEISLIYYPDRSGVEDRVFRIKTERSSATSLPEPRTGHNISGIEFLRKDGDVVDLRFNWFTLYYRYQTTTTYFGVSFYSVDISGEQPLITDKKVILKNDCVHHLVDVYMV